MGRDPEAPQITYPQEIARKKVHLICLIIPLGLILLPRHVVLGVLLPITILYAGADLLRLVWGRLDSTFQKVAGSVLRSHEARHLTGATYLLTAAVTSILAFEKEIATLGLLFLILGDTAGAIIGRKFGRIRIFNKTLEGTAACFTMCLLSTPLTPTVEWHVAVTGAVVATIIELLPLPIDDNLSIPLAAGLVMQMVG
jgi:dolichol kinase